MAIPSGPWRTRVRVYECDSLGHVNNAWYLAYLQQATVEIWPEAACSLWELRRLAVEYLAPARLGDELEVAAWSSGGEAGLPVCGYEIRRRGDGQVIVRAQVTWACPASNREPAGPAFQWAAGLPMDRAPVKPVRLGPDRLGAHSYLWQHTVRQYELDAAGRVNPVEVLRWLEEAKFVACATAGWPVARILGAGTVIVQIRHDGEFYAPLHAGERVEIVSRVYEVGRVKGTWRQEVYRDGEMVALDYASGAFLDLTGRPSPPPPAMLEALIRGASSQP